MGTRVAALLGVRRAAVVERTDSQPGLLLRLCTRSRQWSDVRRLERALASANGHERLDLLAQARRDR